MRADDTTGTGVGAPILARLEDAHPIKPFHDRGTSRKVELLGGCPGSSKTWVVVGSGSFCRFPRPGHSMESAPRRPCSATSRSPQVWCVATKPPEQEPLQDTPLVPLESLLERHLLYVLTEPP